ncbi:MAG: hypothetical protein IJW55_09310 [Clostridia bacterium]|nr:hypothetical protein [Clostridia bacterium]
MTTSVPVPMTARECFTAANERFARGYYLDAQTLFDRACRLEPDNALYAEGRERLQIYAASLGHWFSHKPKSPNTGNGNFFTDCCCEVCGEGGGECCAECCCEGCCENCDGCDCDCG